MDISDIISGFLLEIRRGTVVLCVLAKLRQPTYGYNLIGELAETGIPIEANTLYPLLRRLESQGLLASSWNTEGTKPRKYYVITELGADVLRALVKHWRTITTNLDEILEGN